MFGWSGSSTAATTSATGGAPIDKSEHQLHQLAKATQGLDLLLNDDPTGARRVLEADKDSAYAAAGLGICEFLEAALGMEEEKMASSSHALSHAEHLARKGKAAADVDPGAWWNTSGLQYEVLLADMVTAQSLIHMLSDSYVEYAKAVWKLNAAFKHFASIYKSVFPSDIADHDSVRDVIDQLNERYRTATLAHSLKTHAMLDSASHRPRVVSGAIGKLKHLRASAAGSTDSLVPSTYVSAASSLKAANSATATPPNGEAEPSEGKLPSQADALWTANPITSWIVSGSAYGHGLFELVFALLPPKARKMFSWLGYGTGDRKKALKLLELSATTGSDVHASFATLVLVIYYLAISLLSGWQCDRAGLLASCEHVLDRALLKHSEGTLWILNKAKLERMSGKIDLAEQHLKSALARPARFRQAVSSIQFEMAWVLLSQGRYAEACDAFVAMAKLNNWSHPTYFALASGALHEVPKDQRTPEQEAHMHDYYASMQSNMNKKRFMGSVPTAEIYIERRIRFYRAKTDRWIAEGKLKSTNPEWYESVQIGMALELSLYWNQYAHYPRDSSDRLCKHLSGLLAPASGTSLLDGPEEKGLCYLVRGACRLGQDEHALARSDLEQAERFGSTPGIHEAYTLITPLARSYLAVLECRQAQAEARLNPGMSADRWLSHFAAAENKLQAMFAQTDYDMNGRIESRGQMLRVEISEKKARLGVA